MGPLTQEIMLSALQELNRLLSRGLPKERVCLILGGGGAMILAHGFPKGTTDLDAIPRGMSPEVLTPFVQEIAMTQSLPSDWLNPYFATFSHVLPEDYGQRLIEVFSGTHLEVQALGGDEMLIMKCFAGRTKDIPHARALIKRGADLDRVLSRIETLEKKNIPGAKKAREFLEELLEDH